MSEKLGKYQMRLKTVPKHTLRRHTIHTPPSQVTRFTGIAGCMMMLPRTSNFLLLLFLIACPVSALLHMSDVLTPGIEYEESQNPA